MNDYVSDIAFTPSIKVEQTKRGSRAKLQKSTENNDWLDAITGDLAAFIADRDSFYLATGSAEGQPYIQHRGGPKGFLHVLDEKTLAFADFAGNRHYVTLGNLAENDRAHLFLMDYANRQRVKIWGRAQVVEDDAELLTQLTTDGYRARPERVIIFEIEAIDINCPQHIMPRHDEATVRLITENLTARIGELEAEVKRLTEQLTSR